MEISVIKSIQLHCALNSHSTLIKMQSPLAAWHPTSLNRLVSYNKNRLEFIEVKNDSNSPSNYKLFPIADNAVITCLEWQNKASAPLLAYGTNTGRVHLLNDSTGKNVQLLSHEKKTCNDLSWSTVLPDRLAAGFENMKRCYTSAIAITI